MHGSKNLLTEAQSGDQIAIALDIVVFEVVQETTTTTDEHQKTTTAVVVIFVRFKMFRQNIDALRQQRNLNLRRTRVTFVTTKLADNLSFDCTMKHVFPSLSNGQSATRQRTPQRS